MTTIQARPYETISDAPVLRRGPHGWLALSPEGFRPRIAVLGMTEDDARENFGIELEAWRDLRSRPAPAPTRATGLSMAGK
mgnify:CR=1 FL=1